MKKTAMAVFTVLSVASCTKNKEFAGSFAVQFFIHPDQSSYLVPSSDTTQLWININGSDQEWQFSPVPNNQYSISPTGTNRVLSTDGIFVNVIPRPATLSQNECFYIDKNSSGDVSFRSVASGDDLKILYAEKNNTIWGYSIEMVPTDSCRFNYTNVDTNFCISSFRLIKK